MSDIIKKKKGKKTGAAISGAHEMAEGCNDVLLDEAALEGAELGTTAASGKAGGNAIVNAVIAASRQARSAGMAERRVSEPLSAGHAAASTGDHGVGQGRAADIAVGYPDLLQQPGDLTTGAEIYLRSWNGDNQFGDRDITRPTGQARVSMFNPRDAAGSYGGMQNVSPSPDRPDCHPARQSATPPNGSHSTTGMVTSIPKVAMSGSDAREIMREHLFGGR